MSVKSANRSVRSSGRQAASSRWLLWLARGGFVARRVTYVLIGVLAVQIGLGAGGKQMTRNLEDWLLTSLERANPATFRDKRHAGARAGAGMRTARVLLASG